MSRRALALFLVFAAAAAEGQSPASGSDYHRRFVALANKQPLSDSARLQRLLALDWENAMVDFPEYATSVGYPGQNRRWTDLSVPALTRRRREASDRLLVLRAVNRAKLRPTDQLNYDLFKRGVEEGVEGQRFPSDVLQITQLGGPQSMADVIAIMPTATTHDYEDIIARLDGIPLRIDQTLALLDSGLKLGVTPPKVTLRDVPSQLENLVPSEAIRSPFLQPFTHFPQTVAAADRERLLAAATKSYTERVRPAFQRLHEYVANSYVPRSRESIGMSALPNGAAWYAYDVKVMTTTSRTPQQIHELGLSEVKRIRAEMDSVMRSTGFTGDFAAFATMLRTDPRFFFTDSATIVQAYRDIAKRIDPELPRLFGHLPRLPYGVTTIPSYSAPSQTTAYYQPGSPDAHRAGEFFVNTYKLDMRPKWEMEVLTAHEAVPGHHLQISLSEELENVPEFRRYGGYTAFAEGWGLYSESLGGELGLYKDPYSRYGQLTYEMWRAVRLVLDTGIHGMGWSRDDAIKYFQENCAKTLQDITVEVDRYIVNDAQALAYKSGELEMKSLRAFATRELGQRFDIRAFHDQLLGQGALPLDLLDTRMRGWVAEQKRQPAGQAVSLGKTSKQ
jgi:uncharacterized protein (DUF885 family)